MTRALIRRTAITLIALLGFGHASLALAACMLERGMLTQAIAAEAHAPCADSGTPPLACESGNLCVAHCTADLQLTGTAVALVRSPAQSTSSFVPVSDSHLAVRTGLESRPPGTPPSRILLHSFLL
jgi:hypothetical protein